MSQNPNPEDSNTSSAPPALFHLPDQLGESQPASVKCTKCETVTPHEWIKITPAMGDVMIDPMELLKLTKRLTLCTQCGTLKTIN